MSWSWAFIIYVTDCNNALISKSTSAPTFPSRVQYCALSCPDYKQGFCLRGDACGFAHGVFEAHLHPSRYRTQLCKDGPGCHRPVCFFAHRLDELRSPTHTWMPSAEDLLAVGINPIVVSQAASSGAPTNQAADGSLLAAAAGSASPAFPLPPASTSRIPFPATSLGDPRVVQRQQQQQQLMSSASSTRSSPSPPLTVANVPPPPPPTTPSALEVDLAGVLGELQPAQKQSPAAAAAVMAYDELCK